MNKADLYADNSYKTLAHEDYKHLAYKNSLKGFLRVKGDELEILASEAQEARVVLKQVQILLTQRAWRFPLRHLPLMLCKGPARSGASFLRWRNQQNNRSGVPAWRELVHSDKISESTRQTLLQIEHDRVLFNMQMSIVTFIIRQTRECIEKIHTANSFVSNRKN